MKVTQDGHAPAAGPERATALDGLTAREVPDLRGRLGLSWAGAAQYAGLHAQLVLCLLVIRQFQLESRAFYKVTLLVVGGFAVHALLPLRYRLPFFVALSLGSIVVAFDLVAAAWLIAVSAVLIGICHLPIRLVARVALLLGVGTLLAVSRTDVWPGPWAANIWPIIGSMFMFRLALYLYALQHDATPPTATRTLAYFWMVPNVCFPLFPVVDYSTFHRTYYDTDAVSIYQTGVRWIVRGLTHLLLYRPAHRSGRPGVVPAGNVPPLPACLRSVPPHRGNAEPVRLPPAGNPPPVLPGFQLQRLLAADQHLLERFHDEAGLLSQLLSSAPPG